MFHDVYESDPSESGFPGASSNSFKVSQVDFIRLMDMLIIKANKLHIPLSDIIITFDDGGSCSLWIAKELSKRGLIGHFFISTMYIGSSGFCSESDIIEIDKLGHIIGNHTHTHPGIISRLSDSELKKEWGTASTILKNIINKDVVEACFPGGHYSENQVDILKELGYKTVYTVKPTREIKNINDIEVIGRYSIRNKQPIEQYLSYFGKHSLLRFRMLLRWQLLEILKKNTGSNFDKIRDIIKRF